MKNLILLFAFIFNFCNNAFTQTCVPDQFTINTQSIIDNFATYYPGCTHISQDLIISGSDITNLDGLSQITSVGGKVELLNLSNLTTLSGLDNLNSIGGDLNIYKCWSLNDFTGLQSLDSIGGYFHTIKNSSLTDLSGLENLKFIAGDFRIEDNSNLTSFSGLENLNYCGGWFKIQNNYDLTSFSGIENLDSIGNALTIINNTSLVSLSGLQSLSYIGGLLRIENVSGIANLSELQNLNFVGSINIEDCPDLINLSGLENINSLQSSLRIINNNALSNLTGLENLDSVGYAIYIKNNPALTNISTLQNLKYISVHFEIEDNPSLASLDGLQNLIFIGTNLSIINIPLLSNLSGLENLDTIGASFYLMNNPTLNDISAIHSVNFIGQRINISDNPNLISIDGFNNLNAISSHFTISNNSSLTSITGFNNLKTIGYSFWIENNAVLEDISGLQNLDSISFTFTIRDNPALNNLSGLQNLKFVGSSFLLNNTVLTNLSGFNNLNSVGGFYSWNKMTIRNNSALISLNGLQNLNYVYGGLEIHNNPSLISLGGLGLIDYSDLVNLKISNNSSLSVCSENFICNYINNGGDTEIFDNAIGCEDEDVIFANCAFSKIQFDIFYDLNQNKIKDVDEFFLPDFGVLVEPINTTFYSPQNNSGSFFLDEGEYILNYLSDTTDWNLTTDSASYHVNIDSTYTCDSIAFGFYPSTQNSEMVTTINSPFTRCGFTIKFNVLAKNMGTTIISGTLWFQIDDSVDSLSFIDIPDTTVAPHLYGWHFSNLTPGQKISKEILIQIPGPLDFPIGDYLTFQSHTEYTDATGASTSPTFVYRTQVICAYDPNDKLVSPNRNDNYTLFVEDLIYTVRFQNTGNAEAINIEILDTLDSNLDPSTFVVLSSSHPNKLKTSMQDDQFLSFYFENIFLPDSTFDLEGSQGYVSYLIKTKDGLPEETTINNSASIYFDFNPPILTNTTENIMVTEIFYDNDGDGFKSNEECDDTNPNINPNATEIPYNGIDEDCNPLTLDDDLDQDGFLLAEDCDDNNPNINSDATEIPFNGIDDDCNPLTLDDDLDQDGFLLAEDCDDNNSNINPDATEIPYNGIDDD